MARTGHLTASQEDYLEAIWALIWAEGVARVSDIAERLNVSMPSVTGALKFLARLELVEYTPHKYVTLTNLGMELAEKISARHKMLKRLLTDVLAVDPDLADDNACRIEHAVDEIVSRRLGHFIEFLSHDAEASQLIDRFKAFCKQQEPVSGGRRVSGSKQKAMTLADIKPGRRAKILLLGEAATDQRFAEIGLEEQSVVTVVRIAPLGDPIEIEIDGRMLAIHKAEAHQIKVEQLL